MATSLANALTLDSPIAEEEDEDEFKQHSRNNSVSESSDPARRTLKEHLSGMLKGAPKPKGAGVTTLGGTTTFDTLDADDLPAGSKTPSQHAFQFGDDALQSGTQTPHYGAGGHGGSVSGAMYHDDEIIDDQGLDEIEEGEEEDEEDYEQIEASVTCMALHPTETVLAIGSSPDIIKIWNIRAHKFDSGCNHSGRITALAFSSDGRYMTSAASWESPAVGWTHSIRVWSFNLKTHSIEPASGLVGQEDLDAFDENAMDQPPVPNIPRLSGNAIRLALQSAMRAAEDKGTNLNTTIALGFISQGVLDGKATTEDLLSNGGAAALQQLHQDAITCLAFMPLEEHPCIKLLDEHGISGTVVIASGSQDRTVRLWCYDKSGDVSVHVLRSHKSGVTSLAWSPDGNMLMSGSLDGTIVLWRIWLEPVYESPRGTGAGLVNNPNEEQKDANGDDVKDGTTQHTGRMISCVPLIVQNAPYDCCSIPNSIEPVYTMQFFPTIHTFGRYPEYTVAIGTSTSLLLLRVHSLRVHESPLTSIPEYLLVCRRLDKHARHLKEDKKTMEGIEEEEVNKDEDNKKNKFTSRYRARENASHKKIDLGLRPNVLQFTFLHRQPIDSVRYGGIRSLSVGIFPVERHMAYDLEDALDSKHVQRDLLSVQEKHVKILITNHENEGHLLAWVLNESIDDRTTLAHITPHFCVLGKQNRTLIAENRVIPNGMADQELQGNFLGNFCEQVALPSVSLRKRFDRASLQRDGSGQIMCFTLNCNKSETTDASNSLVDAADGADIPANGLWSWKFNVEASVDFPGDIEPTISSKLAFDTLKKEIAEKKRRAHGGLPASVILANDASRARKLGNADPDYIGRIAHGHEIEFDLPAFVSLLHPMGTTMNEAMRLEEHQRIMGIRVFKYPAPKKVFEEPPAPLPKGKPKKVLSTMDTSGFATADLGNDGKSSKDADESTSSSTKIAESSDGFIGTNGDPGLASSKHLIRDEDESGNPVPIGKKSGRLNNVKYALGKEKDASETSLSAVARVKGTPSRRRLEGDSSSDSSSDSSDSDNDNETSRDPGVESDDGPSVVQWKSRSSRSTSSTNPGGTKRGASKLAQFSAQALSDLAPKKKEKSVFGNNDEEDGEGQSGDKTQNQRGQCASPGECTVQ